MTACEVLKILKERYKISPVQIVPWRDQVLIQKSQSGVLNETSTWRFHGDVQVGGVVSDGYEFPFFVGKLNFNVYKGDINQVDVANHWLIVQLFRLDLAPGFYSTTGDQLKRYGMGSYPGPQLPLGGYNDTADNLNNPNEIIAPYVQVQAYTDITGDLKADVSLTFEGFKVYMT